MLDEIASLKASVRAFYDVIENHNLEDEYEKLYLQYLPEEIEERQEWWDKVNEKQKVKVTTEDE